MFKYDPKKYTPFIGKKFKKLTVVRFKHLKSASGRKELYVHCKCDCGYDTVPFWANVRRGLTSSCGCGEFEARFTHGLTGTPTHNTWENMWNRCNKKNVQHKNNNRSYKNVSVCKRWKSFEAFYKDMGERPEGTSLDRIDNTKGYFKENCRWATQKQQMQNTSKTRMITAMGQTHCQSEWSRITGIPDNTIYYRLQRGLTPEQALGLTDGEEKSLLSHRGTATSL